MSAEQENYAEHLAKMQNHRRLIPPPYGRKIDGRMSCDQDGFPAMEQGEQTRRPQ